MKNVTGYDLSKLICGAFGTLVVLSEITFKVLPVPEETNTLVIHNQKIESAIFYFVCYQRDYWTLKNIFFLQSAIPVSLTSGK